MPYSHHGTLGSLDPRWSATSCRLMTSFAAAVIVFAHRPFRPIVQPHQPRFCRIPVDRIFNLSLPPRASDVAYSLLAFSCLTVRCSVDGVHSSGLFVWPWSVALPPPAGPHKRTTGRAPRPCRKSRTGRAWQTPHRRGYGRLIKHVPRHQGCKRRRLCVVAVFLHC